MAAFLASALPRKLRQHLGIEPARSKYNVRTDDIGKEDRTYKGIRFHSLAEKHFAQLLDKRIEFGDILSWARQIHFGNYVIDFEITHKDGSIELIEIKGAVKPSWVTKHLKFKQAHPELKYRVLRERKDGFFEEMAL